MLEFGAFPKYDANATFCSSVKLTGVSTDYRHLLAFKGQSGELPGYRPNEEFKGKKDFD